MSRVFTIVALVCILCEVAWTDPEAGIDWILVTEQSEREAFFDEVAASSKHFVEALQDFRMEVKSETRGARAGVTLLADALFVESGSNFFRTVQSVQTDGPDTTREVVEGVLIDGTYVIKSSFDEIPRLFTEQFAGAGLIAARTKSHLLPHVYSTPIIYAIGEALGNQFDVRELVSFHRGLNNTIDLSHGTRGASRVARLEVARGMIGHKEVVLIQTNGLWLVESCRSLWTNGQLGYECKIDYAIGLGQIERAEDILEGMSVAEKRYDERGALNLDRVVRVMECDILDREESKRTIDKAFDRLTSGQLAAPSSTGAELMVRRKAGEMMFEIEMEVGETYEALKARTAGAVTHAANRSREMIGSAFVAAGILTLLTFVIYRVAGRRKVRGV